MMPPSSKPPTASSTSRMGASSSNYPGVTVVFCHLCACEYEFGAPGSTTKSGRSESGYHVYQWTGHWKRNYRHGHRDNSRLFSGVGRRCYWRSHRQGARAGTSIAVPGIDVYATFSVPSAGVCSTVATGLFYSLSAGIRSITGVYRTAPAGIYTAATGIHFPPFAGIKHNLIAQRLQRQSPFPHRPAQQSKLSIMNEVV